MVDHHAAKGDRDLVDYLEGRPEVGVGRMIANIARRPRSPFKSWERRAWKEQFVVGAVVIGALAGWFAWFNLRR